MKVFIVTSSIDYHDTTIVDVYASKESADKRITDLERGKVAWSAWLKSPGGTPPPEYNTFDSVQTCEIEVLP